MSTIKDKNLSVVGQQEVDWAARQMKVLDEIKTEFAWQKLIYQLYKEKIFLDKEQINDELKSKNFHRVICIY